MRRCFPSIDFHLLLINLLFFFFIIASSAIEVFGQGCSDAGFCTMGAMKPNTHYSKGIKMKLKSVELSQYLGYTKFNDQILTYTIDFTIGFTKKSALQFKLPYTFVNGSMAKTNGLSDLSLAFTRNLVANDNYEINVTAGAKIPTNNSNIKRDGRPLPMYYQTSLGTYDIVFGAAITSKKWLASVGYQQALNRNGNQFTWGAWAGHELHSESLVYPISNAGLRGKDVMLRIERNFRYSRFNYFTGLLNIYRFTPDIITAPATRERTKDYSTTGLALTWINGLGYKFSVKSSLKLLTGVRLIEREENVDGLSRKLVVNLGYTYRF